MPLAADGIRRLARVLQTLFLGQARDLAARLTVEGVADGEPVDLSHWVAPMAQAVRPLLLGFWQAGALRAALRLRPGYRGREGLRTYAPGNETIFSPRKGVMGNENPVQLLRHVQRHAHVYLCGTSVAKAGRGSGDRGEPGTGVRVYPLNHPGRPSLTPLQAWRVSKAAGNLGLGFDVTNPRILDAVDAAALSFCRETLDTVAGDVQEALADLRGVLREGVPRGDAQRVIARRVRRVFADPYRAFRIAVTESSRATHGGQLLAARDLGATVKTWSASPGACPRCLALDGKQVGIDEPFEVDPRGGPYAVTSHPPLHPHCDCDMTEEV
jgi:hypothetical protein